MRVRKWSCAKLIFFLLIGFFLILRLPQQSDHIDHAPGVCISFSLYFLRNVWCISITLSVHIPRIVSVSVCICNWISICIESINICITPDANVLVFVSDQQISIPMPRRGGSPPVVSVFVSVFFHYLYHYLYQINKYLQQI